MGADECKLIHCVGVIHSVISLGVPEPYEVIACTMPLSSSDSLN